MKPYHRDEYGNHPKQKKSSTILNSLLVSSGDAASPDDSVLRNMSTLTLLEHINLNVPNHDYILDFYFHILGMGLDPRRASNVAKGSGTVWANCGASQFHLPVGETAQVIPGSIGLLYDDLTGVERRLKTYDDKEDKPFTSYRIELEDDDGNTLCVKIVDKYGNVFYCRRSQNIRSKNDNDELMYRAKQPNIFVDNEEHMEEFKDMTSKYGLKSDQNTECRGISYVEFYVSKGNNKIEDIAEFYDCVFNAPTTVIGDPNDTDSAKVAIIGFGKIDPETGRTSQSLLFREIDMDLPPYDGHHLALYVGESKADFEQAFANTMEAGVVWVNPRFSDKVTNLNTAKKWRQFRFKDLLSLEHGRKIFELEHEVRCIEHESWPGGDIFKDMK